MDAYDWSTTNYFIMQPLAVPEKSHVVSGWAPGRRLLTCASHSLDIKKLFQLQRQENAVIANVGKRSSNQYAYEDVAYMVSNYMRDHLGLQDVAVSRSGDFVAMMFFVEDSIDPHDVTHPLVEVYKCVDKDSFTLVQHW